MRVQAEATQQLSSVQSDMRVSYGNDALMPPDSTPSVDSVAVEQDNLGFIHPESFNQANTENHGTLNWHNMATALNQALSPQQGLALKSKLALQFARFETQQIRSKIRCAVTEVPKFTVLSKHLIF